MDFIHNLTSIPSMLRSQNHKKLLNYLEIDDRINNFLLYAQIPILQDFKGGKDYTLIWKSTS